MEAFVSIALISWLFKIAGLVIGVMSLIYLSKRAGEELKKKGPRGIVDEVIIMLVVVGLVAFICWPGGLETIGSIVDRIIAMFFDIVDMVLDALEETF